MVSAEREQSDLPEWPLIGGRYELGPLLGAGGAATVYWATDHHQQREVALKLFYPGVIGSDESRLQHELRTLGPLDHPGLAMPYDVGSHGARTYLVMQLVDGRSLADRLLDGALSQYTAMRLGWRVAETLTLVHASGVVHRDLKPGNILLGADGAVISDFGVAKLVDDTVYAGTDVIVGTACYMAPEQVNGCQVGPAADIYALGLVLLESLTGHREYDGGPLEAAMARLHRIPVVPDGIPHGLAELIRHMTASDPSARPSATAVARRLGTMLPGRRTPMRAREASGETRPLPAVPAARTPSEGRRSRGGVAGAVAAAVLLGAGVLTLGSPTSVQDASTPAARPGLSASKPKDSRPVEQRPVDQRPASESTDQPTGGTRGVRPVAERTPRPSRDSDPESTGAAPSTGHVLRHREKVQVRPSTSKGSSGGTQELADLDALVHSSPSGGDGPAQEPLASPEQSSSQQYGSQHQYGNAQEHGTDQEHGSKQEHWSSQDGDESGSSGAEPLDDVDGLGDVEDIVPNLPELDQLDGAHSSSESQQSFRSGNGTHRIERHDTVVDGH